MSLKYEPASEQPRCSSSPSTSVLTSDDTREAHSFLESDQLLTSYRCSGGRADSMPDILGTVHCHGADPAGLPTTFSFFITLKPRVE